MRTYKNNLNLLTFIAFSVIMFVFFMIAGFAYSEKVQASNIHSEDNTIKVKLLDQKDSTDSINITSKRGENLEIRGSSDAASGNESVVLDTSEEFTIENVNGEIHINDTPVNNFTGSGNGTTAASDTYYEFLIGPVPAKGTFMTLNEELVDNYGKDRVEIIHRKAFSNTHQFIRVEMDTKGEVNEAEDIVDRVLTASDYHQYALHMAKTTLAENREKISEQKIAVEADFDETAIVSINDKYALIVGHEDSSELKDQLNQHGLDTLDQWEEVYISESDHWMVYQEVHQTSTNNDQNNEQAAMPDEGSESPDLDNIDRILLRSTQGHPIQLKNNQRVYRGELELKIVDNELKVINHVDLDSYLKGVVPAEMPSQWHPEALKTQAVISRTYAAYQKKNRMNAAYHVTDSETTQVYRGYQYETANTNEAIDSTAGEKLYYDGHLINALYHSNAGGHTSPSEEVWGQAVEYLKPVESPWDQIAKAQGNAEAYSWEVKVSWEELSQKLDEKYDIGLLEEIEIIESLSNNRVAKARYVGTEGEKILEGEENRAPLGLRSAKFDIESNEDYTSISFLSEDGALTTKKQSGEFYAVTGQGESTKVNQGDDHYFIKNDSGKKKADKILNYLFTGKGFGHGVGLSQWGAQGMAQEGYQYRQILDHYYSGNIQIQ